MLHFVLSELKAFSYLPHSLLSSLGSSYTVFEHMCFEYFQDGQWLQ